jgi:hypothetical protein
MLPPSGSESEVELSFVPDSVGLFQYRVDITQLEDEMTHRNNTESFALRVLERERRVLILAGGPSPDVAAVRQLLEADTDTDVTLRTLKGTDDGAYYEGPWSRTDQDPDVMILIGFPGATAPQADVERVRGLVNSGTPVLFMMDRTVALPRLQSELSAVLPARPAAIRPGYMEGSFEPTQAAGRHAIFDISERRNVQDWLRLPPLSLGQTRWETSPGAAVLATSRIRGISIDDPVLVVGRVGSRRSAAILASGFWKWNNAPADLQQIAARWKELFSNLMLWLVTEDDDRLVRVAPRQGVVDESEAVVFGGQVYDENLQPLSNVSLTLQVRNPNGEVFPYTLQSVGNGQYRADLGSFPAGTYHYEAIAETDEGELGRDQGQFTVGALSLEFRNPSADRTLMRRVAQRSGGSLLDTAGLAELERVLTALPDYKPVTRVTENQLRLWRYAPLGVLILILMTVEWFFRKRFGLV